jgi:exopolysaccharide production protein ExoY
MGFRNEGPILEIDSPGIAISGLSVGPQSRTPLVERCCSALLLAAFGPVLAGAAAITRVLSGRSPFVAVRRVGCRGETIWVLKLRTMWEGSSSGPSAALVEYLEDTEIPTVKTGSDPRVSSRFAAFARRFSLDELPQLVHVVEGRMRLAGPRPLTRLELDAYYGPHSAEVLSVLPGITGLWQVMGRNRLTYKQRLRLDRFFVRRANLKLYLWILLRTPQSVLSGRGAC